MNKKIGFIGCGNMAGAMIGGIIKSGLMKKDEIIASAVHEETTKRAAKEFGIDTTTDNVQVAKNARVVVLAVKPVYYFQVIDEIKDVVNEEQIIISIAPGITIKSMEERFGKSVKMVRTMPNTPALVGEGITAMCINDNMTEEETQYAKSILESFGKAEIIKENLMDVVVSVSGSSPAYVFMFIEAMADAAVADGMPRKQAYTFAARSVLGSAKMVLETGRHPGELKDMVCSPGGTTIEAVRVLEEKGMRSSVIEAMKACTKKASGK